MSAAAAKKESSIASLMPSASGMTAVENAGGVHMRGKSWDTGAGAGAGAGAWVGVGVWAGREKDGGSAGGG